MVVHETFLSAGCKHGFEVFESYARTFRCLALLRWESTSSKGAMWAIVCRIFYCPLLNS